MAETPKMFTDGKLAQELRRMAVDAELADDPCWRVLAAAAHRLEVIAQHTRQDDAGIWSYYRHEMWGHGNG